MVNMKRALKINISQEQVENIANNLQGNDFRIDDVSDFELKKLIENLKNSSTKSQAAIKLSDLVNHSVFDVDGNPMDIKKVKKSREFLLNNIEPVLDAIKDDDHITKVSCAWILGNLDDEIGVQPLIFGLSDKNSGFRGACVINLVKLKKFSLNLLIESLNSQDKIKRRESIKALGEIADNKASNSLIKALGDSDWNVRFRSIEALGKIGDTNALEPISNLTNDSSSNVRKKAVEVIGILAAGERIPTQREL